MNYLAVPLFQVALVAAAPAAASAQDPSADAGRVLPRSCIPIHTAPDDLGTPYGIWAAADTYKASFHGDMTFVPYLGSEYPHNQPWSWRTRSVRVGNTELIERGAVPARRQHDYRYEYRFGAVTEAYDVRPDGLEQTFVLHARPAAGDLVVTGAVVTALHAPDAAAAHRALEFRDGRGAAIVGYGEAFAFDARGDRIEVLTAFARGEITLTVPGTWLATATLPVTVDPLLTRVLIANAVAGYSVRDVDIALDDLANDVLLTYVRAASQYDDDVFARVCNTDFSGQAEIYTDVTSNWDSDQARCAWVGGAARWVVVFRRYFATNPLRFSLLRCHVHASGNTTLQTNYGSLPAAAGINHWRPVVGGTADMNVGVEALVLFQVEDNTNTAGHWADIETSAIGAARLDVSTTNGTFGTQFTVYAHTTFDCERPAITKVVDGSATSFSWFCAWQYYVNNVAGDDWDVMARRISHLGVLSTGIWLSDNTAQDTDHSFGPMIEGANGHYAVAFTTTDLATTPGKTRSVTGNRVWVEPLEWPHGASVPLASGNRPPVLVDSATANQLTVRGLGFDLNDNSHWALSYADVGSIGRGLRYARVGYQGRRTETGALFATVSTGPLPYGGGCVYDGDGRDFKFGYGYDESVFGQTLEYVQPPPRGAFGYGCSTAIIDWEGNQQIGARFNRVTISSAPTNSIHFMAVSLGTADLPLVDPAVRPGCRLLVDSGAGFLGTMPFLIGSSGSWYIPLPEQLPPMTLHFQDWMLTGLQFQSSRRLSVPVVK